MPPSKKKRKRQSNKQEKDSVGIFSLLSEDEKKPRDIFSSSVGRQIREERGASRTKGHLEDVGSLSEAPPPFTGRPTSCSCAWRAPASRSRPGRGNLPRFRWFRSRGYGQPGSVTCIYGTRGEPIIPPPPQGGAQTPHQSQQQLARAS